MQTVYRGTQRETIMGARTGVSFAYSLPVAIIWSARPSDIWASRPAQFLSTSTVHVAQADVQNPLVFDESYVALGDVLRRLDFGKPDGITEDEVRRVYNYLHNRLIGKAAGGEFSYNVLDEDGEPRDEDEVPLSFTRPETLISMARDDWDGDPSIAVADDVVADTFIFADAPSIQRAAARLGYDALVYLDVFQGGERAAQELLGRNVNDLEGIEVLRDLDGKRVPFHMTLRPLTPDVIVEVTAVSTAEILRARTWAGSWYA